MPRRTFTVFSFTLIIAAVLSAWPARAQVFDLEQQRQQLAEIHSLWRFHTGDDPDGKLGWASPAFDDSAWPLIRGDEGWGKQGYKGYSGMAWYRFKVQLPQTPRPIALLIPRLSTSYQIFVDGRLIGQFGGLPPHEQVVFGDRPTFLLPPEAAPPGKIVTIAIRVWHWSHWAAYRDGGPDLALRIGDADVIRELASYVHKVVFWRDASNNLLLLIHLLAASAACALFVLRRKDREYLWFGLWEFTRALVCLSQDYTDFHRYPVNTWDIFGPFLQILATLLFLGFLCNLLRVKSGLVYRIAIAAPLVALAALVPIVFFWLSVSVGYAIVGLSMLPYFACVLTLLYRGVRQGIPDARLLLFPVALVFAAQTAYLVLVAIETAGASAVAARFAWFEQLSLRPFPFSVPDVTELLVQMAILLILVLRFSRSRADEERLNTELESARAVQSILVPDEAPAIPGFIIQSVYRPYGQVGGDFFQIIPLPHAAALVCIGDVSGKGMPAAMTVSLLVGTLRALADSTQHPGEILSSMNRHLLDRARSGFTTCLVLRADGNGALTMANAGHIAPYLNGAELSCDNGLPLGLTESAAYVESSFHLAQGEQLMLTTDGVVEARNKTGELYGFERTAAISTQSAEAIAHAAQAFGQDDDITVLTLTWLAPQK
jgi:hypothetical protein